MRKVVWLLWMLVWLPALQADERDDARIDLIAEKDQIEIVVQKMSEGGTSRHADWRKELAPYYIAAVFPASKEWKTGFINFLPKGAGKVVLNLAGPNIKGKNKIPENIWIAYDDIKVEGAALENGSFESLHPSGQPKGWHMPPYQTDIVGSVKKGGAPEGLNYVVVWHNSRYAQALTVTEGKPVTLTFRYRLEPES